MSRSYTPLPLGAYMAIVGQLYIFVLFYFLYTTPHATKGLTVVDQDMAELLAVITLHEVRLGSECLRFHYYVAQISY
jgi:hypothetical protein